MTDTGKLDLFFLSALFSNELGMSFSVYVFLTPNKVVNLP